MTFDYTYFSEFVNYTVKALLNDTKSNIYNFKFLAFSFKLST